MLDPGAEPASLPALAAALLAQVAIVQPGPDPTTQQLVAIGQHMLAWVRSPRTARELLAMPRACGKQELLYLLHVVAAQPALYLVSDGPGVASPPHEHSTWAVIVGLSGNERNLLYGRDTSAGSLRLLRTVDIGANDVVHLRSDAIHATVAADELATFHLHLYGKPLDELAPYASRCYVPFDDHTIGR